MRLCYLYAAIIVLFLATVGVAKDSVEDLKSLKSESPTRSVLLDGYIDLDVSQKTGLFLDPDQIEIGSVTDNKSSSVSDNAWQAVGTGKWMGVTWDGQFVWALKVNGSGYLELCKLDTNGAEIICHPTQIIRGGWVMAGLVWVQGNFYVASPETNTIYMIDNTGNIIGTYPLAFKPYDLTWDGQNLWSCTGNTPLGFPHYINKHAMDSSLTVIGSWNSLSSNVTISLTFDGTNMWVGDYGGTDRIYKVDLSSPATVILDSLDSPSGRPLGLGFDGQGLYLSTYITGLWYYGGIVESCCVTPGDANHDGSADITDLTYYVDYMFQGGLAPVCFEEFDNNGSCEGGISNLTYFIDWMFGGLQAPVPCHNCP